jgi:hypothetical protein
MELTCVNAMLQAILSNKRLTEPVEAQLTKPTCK